MAFYKGFLPNFTRLGTWNVVMFLTLEQVNLNSSPYSLLLSNDDESSLILFSLFLFTLRQVKKVFLREVLLD